MQPCPLTTTRRGYRFHLLAGLILLAAQDSTAWAGQPALDPTTGEIDGLVALAISPVHYEGKHASEILELQGCEVHLVPIADRDGEKAHPCTTWFLEEKGTYEFWIEAPGQMSPHARKMVYQREEFRGKGMYGATAVGPAGRVLLPVGNKPLEPHHQLRLLHAGDHRVEDLLQIALTRRAATTDLAGGVRMPAGPTVAALWDPREEQYVALSRPFEVPGDDAVVVAPLESPTTTSAFLVAEIRRARATPFLAESGMEIFLDQGGVSRPPDLAVITVLKARAIWYDLAPGPVELRARSRTEEIEPVGVMLGAGSIERIVADLEPLPTLTVTLDLPFAIRDEPLHLGVRRAGADTWFRHTAVSEETEVRFEGLPKGLYDLVLETSLGPFGKEIEVMDPEHFESLAPPVTVLSGTVFKGDNAHRASLAFTSTSQRTRTVETDRDGAYEMVSLESMRSVSIELEESPFPPYVEYFPRELAGTVTRDFQILDHEIVARVFDSVSGKGIEGARVVGRSTYIELCTIAMRDRWPWSATRSRVS